MTAKSHGRVHDAGGHTGCVQNTASARACRIHRHFPEIGTFLRNLLFTQRIGVSAAARRWLALAALAALSGCTTSPVANQTLRVDVAVLDSARKFEVLYALQPGDQIEVFLQRHPDFTRKVGIRPDGFISLPVIDEVRAAGKSPGELAALLKILFSSRLKDPEVNVIVLNPPEPMVYVVGQVGAPKALPLRQAATLAQALAQSGDATKSGALSSTSVIRLNKDGYLESHVLDTHGKAASQPEIYMAMSTVLLKPNDLILVPESYRSQVLRALQDTSVALAPLFNVLILREIYR